MSKMFEKSEKSKYRIRLIIATTKFVGPYCYVYIVGTSCFAVWTLKELGERKKVNAQWSGILYKTLILHP